MLLQPWLTFPTLSLCGITDQANSLSSDLCLSVCFVSTGIEAEVASLESLPPTGKNKLHWLKLALLCKSSYWWQQKLLTTSVYWQLPWKGVWPQHFTPCPIYSSLRGAPWAPLSSGWGNEDTEAEELRNLLVPELIFDLGSLVLDRKVLTTPCALQTINY